MLLPVAFNKRVQDMPPHAANPLTTPVERPAPNVVTVEVIRSGLDAAAEQMATSVERSSRSQVIREMLDYSTALFDLTGGILAQSTRIPVHLNSMTRALRTMLGAYYTLSEWAEGDIFCTNDPFAGGQHLPDIMTFSLVVHDGQPVAICGTLGHHLDVGGRGSGSYGADATEIYQEGFRISPCRIGRKGVVDPLFFELLRPNIRVPDKTIPDLQAQLAALQIGAGELRRIVGRFGVATFTDACAELVAQSERRMRALIAALPDGTYLASDMVDGDGLDDDPVPVQVAVTVKGSELIVDFTGTGAQTRGPINCPIAATESAVYFAVISVLAPHLSPNYGCYNPVTVVAPPGSVVNPRLPAPVVGRNVLTHRINNVVSAALGQMLPDRATAAYYSNSNVYILSALEESGRANVLFEIEVGGWGGNTRGDGHDCYSAGIHNLKNNPIELTEQEFPARFLSYELRTDSGGAGRHRGGLGACRKMELLADSTFSAQFDRMKFPPPGAQGGLPGATASIQVIRDGVTADLPGKVLAHPLKRGDVLVIASQGGGGFGPPEERSRAAITRDIEEGRMTRNAAQAEYGYVSGEDA